MKKAIVILAAILAATSVMSAPKLPKGFIVYSKGRDSNRTLHRVKLAPSRPQKRLLNSSRA
jgi:hypothetical protein